MNKKVNLYILCIVIFLQGLVFYGPVAALYRQSRGLSMYEIFLIESIFMVLMLSFEVPWGWFADRFGYKKTLVIANFLLFASKIVFYEADSFFLFLLERVLMALAFAGISGCDTALLYSSVEEGKSEKAFGIYLSCSSAGFFVASLLSGPIVVKSMDLSALYTIIPYAIAAVLILFIKDIKYVSEEKPGLKQSIKSILSNKSVLLIVGASALAGEVSHSIGVFLNQPQYIKSGISVGYFGVLTAFMQGVCMLSAKTHKLTKRFGQANTVKTLLIGMLISCIVLIFTKNPWATIITVALIQGSFAVIQPTVLDIENKAILLQNRATILSMYAMSGDIIASIVNISVGRAADVSVETAFAVCGVVAFIAGILSWIYFARVRTAQSDKK